jgi:hypothetical protein
MNVSNLRSLLACALAAFLVAFALSAQPLFEDLENYFYFFNQIKESGLIESFSIFLALTGKFEPIIFGLFYLLSLFLPSSPLAFLFVNFFILNVGFAFLVKKVSVEKCAISFFFVLLAVLSYSYFSREIYILRSMYAFLVLLLFVNSSNMSHRVLFFALGTLTHISFSVFALLYFLIEICVVRLSKPQIIRLYFLTILLCMIALYFVEHLAFLSASGDITVFTYSNDSHVMQSAALILFTLLASMAVAREKLNTKELTLAIFCIFLTSFALLNFNSYHLMNRVAAPALCIAPFLILRRHGSAYLRLFKYGYAVSTVATFRLLYLFHSGNFLTSGSQ